VLNALVLVNQETRRANGVLSATTRKALDQLWSQQKENGAWAWLDFGLNPWEKDGAYYGASLAAVAVGMAGKDYRAGAGVKSKVSALKKYLQSESAGQPLHHRTVALWASSWWPGLLSDQARKKLIEELLDTQEADGGWSLAKLGKKATARGDWKAHQVYPEGEGSDGYATGLAVLVLKRAGVAADTPKLQKGMVWLASRQKEGTWPTAWLNKRRDPQSNAGKFMRDAATAFAVLALAETGPGPARGKR
jgi:squalene-hopene/tetraprenyl-beta-curcumene cyclase